MKSFRLPLFLVVSFALGSCGGGGGGSAGVTENSSVAPSDPIAGAAANVATVKVDSGPSDNAINTLYTSVKICAPGSASRCQTIDHIEIDTGSSGLRLLSSVVDSSLGLQFQTDSGGSTLAECVKFVDGYSWGPLARADMTISGETALNLPVQIIGDASLSSRVPADCSSSGPSENTVADFGANGVLGVSVFAQDCGSGCASVADSGVYYACNATTCTPSTLAVADQLQNPVTLFPTDNNGVIVQLPSVPSQGAASVTGSLVFGVDTQNNNASGSARVLTVDPNNGHLTTVFNGTTYPQSFFDTGSNGLFFPDSSIKKCSGSSGFYCPSTTQNLSATARGENGASTTISFSVADASKLGVNDDSLVAFANLGGKNPTMGFDWGLPFYYGRNVYTVFETGATSAGTGPYVAF